MISDSFHRLFFFLNLPGGELLKKFVETILFLMVFYMVSSEYRRERKKEFLYLLSAIGIFLFEKIVKTLFLIDVVFGEFRLRSVEYFLPVFENYFESLALLFLGYAFMYPYFKESRDSGRIKGSMKFKVIIETITLTIVAGIIETLWLKCWMGSCSPGFSESYYNLVFIIVKLGILARPFMHVLLEPKFEKIHIRYRYNVMLAFGIYMITPALQFINFIFLENVGWRLRIFELPFPFLSILLFSRVIYLKLVDKATIRDQLKDAQEKYKHEKELSQMKDEFVSKVSHELRTPLTPMKLYTDILYKEKLGEVNAKQKDALKKIKDEANRLTDLINDILNLAKLEAGKEKLYLSEIDLHEFVNDEMYTKFAEEKGIKLSNNIPAGFIVKVDPSKFKQVYINLVTNAIKYTPEGGEIAVSANSLGKEWVISITDNGSGIGKEDLEKLFEKFYQAEHYMTRSKGGTGLGLSIVKEIVSLHGGRIEVQSAEGKGSVFSVIIPRKLPTKDGKKVKLK